VLSNTMLVRLRSVSPVLFPPFIECLYIVVLARCIYQDLTLVICPGNPCIVSLVDIAYEAANRVPLRIISGNYSAPG
jgi:hypothetical protein